MSNAYGAGSPQAGLNTPGNMPPWLMNLWNYVNPMSQAMAGGVDDQGRPTTPIAGAQASALKDSLTARPAPPAMMASMVARGPGGGSGGGGGASGGYDPGINAALHPAAAPIVPPAVAAYAGGGIGSGYPTPTSPLPAPITPYDRRAPTGTPSATPRPDPHARQKAAVAAAAPQVPWITDLNDRQNLPAGNGPLGRNAQTKQGMLDLSKLFSRTG